MEFISINLPDLLDNKIRNILLYYILCKLPYIWYTFKYQPFLYVKYKFWYSYDVPMSFYCCMNFLRAEQCSNNLSDEDVLFCSDDNSNLGDVLRRSFCCKYSVDSLYYKSTSKTVPIGKFKLIAYYISSTYLHNLSSI